MPKFYHDLRAKALLRNRLCVSTNSVEKKKGHTGKHLVVFWLVAILLNAIAPHAYSNEGGNSFRTSKFPPYGPGPSCSDVGTSRYDIESAYGVNSTYRSVSVIGTGDLLVNYTTGGGLVNSKSKIVRANGTMVDGPLISISPTTNNNSDQVFIKGLTDGNVLVYWYSGSSGTGLTDAYFKIYNQAGSEVVAATKINSSPGSLNRFVESAQLSNGNIIFTWATGGTDYSMRRFKLNGTPVDNAQLSATDLAGMTGQSMYACKIAANDNGRFMLLMDSYSLVYRAMIFENDAFTPVQVGGSNSFVAMTAGFSGQHVDKTPNIIALPNNKFLLACRIQPTSATASRSLAFKVYNDDGSVAVADKTIRQIYSWGSVSFTPVAVADGFYMRYFYNDLGTNGPGLGKVDYFEKYDFNCNFISDSKSCLPTLTSTGNVYPFQDSDNKMGLLINDKINESDAATEKNVWVLRNNTSPCTAPTITGNPPNRTICAGGNTSFSSTATGATGYQWQVNTGSGFSDISNGGVYSGAATSTLTITGATAGMNGYLYRCVALNGGANCSANSNAATLTVSSISLVATMQANVACNGGSNGAATVTASGGTSPYSYSWSPSGGTAATATGLAAGTYTVTVTDNLTCSATKTYTITQPTAISATTSQVNVACNGGSNGSATVVASGGAGSYSYSWSPSGGIAATATGLAAGSYTCTITDANNCSITRTFIITQPTAISTTGSQVNVACNGSSNGSATVTVSGGAGSYTYSWSPSGGTAATATGLAAGSYTVTVTDANSCSTTRNFTITQPIAMTATTSQTNVSCNSGSNGSATVTVSGGVGTKTYSWRPSGGTAATATGLAAGTYTVMVTDANECSATQSVTITEPSPITVSTTPGSETICSGGQTNIALSSVPSGASFTWSVSTVSGNVSGASASTGTAIQQTLTGSGVVKYIINPTNSLCAGQTKEVVITVNALTTIELQPSDKSIYDEETAKFAIEANNASSYKWQVNAGNGFTDLSDDEHYSGTSSYILKISNAIGSMNGNLYRCVATGNCAPVPSNSVKLTVKVRTAQTISFASADTKVYGDDDYSPAANSNSGLELDYSSSDESVAEIVNGQIHIKKAGQVTITVSQAGNDDYKPAASVQQVLAISKKPITASLAASPAISKVYDTYTGIKLAADNYILNDVEKGDDVIVRGTASFEDSNAGDDKTIHVAELILSGEQAENYALTTISATVNGAIKRKEITLSLQSSPLISKTYNASATTTLAASNYILDGILGEDDVTIASSKAVYSDKKAGADKEITVTDFVLGGEEKNNYTVTTQSATTSGTIKAKEITLSLVAIPAISKIYDGTAAATVPEAKYQLQGIEAGDDVTVEGTAIYNNKNAGGDKTVTVNEFVMNGEDADNYHLSTTELTAEGTVEKATLTVRVISDANPITKEYDGTTKANISADNYVVEGIVGEDEVVLNKPEKGVYEDKHGGSEKKVTVSGLQISGEDGDNYQLESTTISGNVGKITRKVIGVTADSKTKVYGQADPALTYVAEGKLDGDELPGSLERTAGKDVGNYKVEQGSLTGGDDYLIEWFQNSSFTITPAPLIITAEDKTKKQGAANPAFTFSYKGLAEDDQPSVLEVRPTAATNATTGSPIGYYDIEVSGAASANYTISYAKGKLTVTPSGGDNYNVKVWSSSPDVLQVRIFTTVAQKSAIILYTETGQQVILQQHQLSVGINSFSVPVGHLASSTYVLSVAAEKFKDAQKVKVK